MISPSSPKRLLSDAPLYQDVWQAFAGKKAADRVPILLSPVIAVDAEPSHRIAAALARDAPKSRPIRIPRWVRAELTLRELVTIVLPMTQWWQQLGRPDPVTGKADTALRRQALDEISQKLLQAGSKVKMPDWHDGPGWVHRIWVERDFGLAAHSKTTLGRDFGDALRTIKADAAIRLFQPSFQKLCWAVVDTGIEARLDCFTSSADKSLCRIARVYDFSKLTEVLSDIGAPDDTPFRESTWAILDERLGRAAGGSADTETDPSALVHGTAVAGLIGACDDASQIFGVCPDIQLIDIRVMDPLTGAIPEANVLAALGFVSYLNSLSGMPRIHGLNLSLQVLHDVTKYACGASPVCEEVNRVAANGVVVVAAAGNLAHRTMIDSGGIEAPHYFGMSIADPGNADGAITVGSTHRRDPHRYGVSYFSGRGPTGDGRAKPDLVAPGEKVDVVKVTGGQTEGDGTSYSAALVSGACAMLMARYPELIGRPAEIKRILRATATDLGRREEFQGAGLLDVLRAMQWGGHGNDLG